MTLAEWRPLLSQWPLNYLSWNVVADRSSKSFHPVSSTWSLSLPLQHELTLKSLHWPYGGRHSIKQLHHGESKFVSRHEPPTYPIPAPCSFLGQVSLTYSSHVTSWLVFPKMRITASTLVDSLYTFFLLAVKEIQKERRTLTVKSCLCTMLFQIHIIFNFKVVFE